MEDNSLGSILFEPVDSITEMAKIDRKNWWKNVSQSSLEIKTRLKVVQERFPEPFSIISRHAKIGRTSGQSTLQFPQQAAEDTSRASDVEIVEMVSQATAAPKRKHPAVVGADDDGLNCNHRHKCGKTATTKVARSFYCAKHAEQHLKVLQTRSGRNRAKKIAAEALIVSHP